MSQTFFQSNLRRLQEIEKGNIPIIEPDESLPLEARILGRAVSDDVRQAYTLYRLGADDDMAAKEAYYKAVAEGASREYKDQLYREGVAIGCHRDTLSNMLHWSLVRHFGLTGMGELIPRIYLYEGWVASPKSPYETETPHGEAIGVSSTESIANRLPH